MCDQEFLEKNPVSVYHGTYFREGTVGASFTNPRVAKEPFLLSESYLFEAVVEAREEMFHFPDDCWNTANLRVMRRALIEVQEKKREFGIPLDVPPITLLDEVANTNRKHLTKLDWAYEVLVEEIRLKKGDSETIAEVIELHPSVL